MAYNRKSGGERASRRTAYSRAFARTSGHPDLRLYLRCIWWSSGGGEGCDGSGPRGRLRFIFLEILCRRPANEQHRLPSLSTLLPHPESPASPFSPEAASPPLPPPAKPLSPTLPTRTPL